MANNKYKTLYYEQHFVKVSDEDEICLHRFYNETSNTPVFMIHGAMEDGKIFYTRKEKGFGPYLAKNGFDVFIADMRAKGSSKPKGFKQLTYSQTDLITNDIPKCIDEVLKLTAKDSLHIATHSWGGVWLYAFLARYNEQYNIKSHVLFASKRRISVWNPKRILYADMIWNWGGRLSCFLVGYGAFKKLRVGSEGEPKRLFLEMNKWVYTKQWFDPNDNFDYKTALHEQKLSPSLHLTGIKDDILGNPIDVELLMKEAGEHQEADLHIVGKSNGNLHNYNHIDILTHKLAEEDHFPMILEWMKNND